VDKTFAPEQPIDLVGLSMGGLVTIGVNLKKVALEDLHLCKEKRKALATCKGRT
jgi:hypothetical protein